jgi:hypothetical protein
VRHLVRGDCVIARPFLEVQALAQGEGSLMESGSNGHDSSGLVATTGTRLTAPNE